MKQGVLFFARLQCFRHVQRRARAIARLVCRSLYSISNRWFVRNSLVNGSSTARKVSGIDTDE